MLSQKSLPVIQATLPVVGANIQHIAECFYWRMFSAHPQLLDGLFNRGNQADGQQQQVSSSRPLPDPLPHSPPCWWTIPVTCLKHSCHGSATNTSPSESTPTSTR